MRLSRHHHHSLSSHEHSPPDSKYHNQSSKRHSHDFGYPTNDYQTSIWHVQNMSNSPQQQINSQMKHNSGSSENPLLKLNELSRYSSTRTTERRSL